MTYGYNDYYRQQSGVHPVLDQIFKWVEWSSKKQFIP